MKAERGIGRTDPNGFETAVGSKTHYYVWKRIEKVRRIRAEDMRLDLHLIEVTVTKAGSWDPPFTVGEDDWKRLSSGTPTDLSSLVEDHTGELRMEKRVERSAEEAYATVRRWFLPQKVRMSEERPPSVIAGKHGNDYLYWGTLDIRMPKFFRVEVRPDGSGAVVAVTLAPFIHHYQFMQAGGTTEKVFGIWRDWISTLWTALGTGAPVQVAMPKMEKSYFSPLETQKEAEEGLRIGRRNLTTGALLTPLAGLLVWGTAPAIRSALAGPASDLVFALLGLPFAAGVGLLVEGGIRWGRARRFLSKNPTR